MHKVIQMLKSSWQSPLIVTLSCMGFVFIDHAVFAYLYDWHTNTDMNPATILAFFPDAVFKVTEIYYLSTVAFFVSGFLWIQRYEPQKMAVITVILALVSESYFLQNVSWTDHRMGLPFYLLLLLAAREFFLTHKWLILGAQVGFVWFYCFTGFEKLYYDATWANGSTLQVFMHYFGRENSVIREWVLGNVRLAQIFQWCVLLIECGAVFLLWRPLRYWVVAGLCLFHLGLEETFAYRYFIIAILLVRFYTLDPDQEDKKLALQPSKLVQE